jgi:hypothetical protein
MRIAGDYFYVDGIYHLRCEDNTKIILSYPFPVDSLYGKIDSLFIFNLTSNEIIHPIVTYSHHVNFDLISGNEKEIELQIMYRQRILGNKAEYILQTTRSWGKPLEDAHYQLITSANTYITRFSLPPMDSIQAGEQTIYYWEEHNYLPVRNLIFEFRDKP